MTSRRYLNCFYDSIKGHDSSVGIENGNGLDGRGLFPGRDTVPLFFIASRPALGPTHSPNQWVPMVISLWIKLSGRETDHSPPCSAKIKNGGDIPRLPHTSSWHSAYLVKHRENFALLPYDTYYITYLLLFSLRLC
jgi:hypothetical protein